MSGVSGNFSVQLARRLRDWSAGSLLPCRPPIVRPVCPCVVSFSNFHEPDTHDLLRTSRLHPRSILVRHVQHAGFSRHMLATSTRGCHEDATRRLPPWNLSYAQHSELAWGDLRWVTRDLLLVAVPLNIDLYRFNSSLRMSLLVLTMKTYELDKS